MKIKWLKENEELKQAYHIISEAGKDMAMDKGWYNWYPAPITIDYMIKNKDKMNVYGLFDENEMIATFTIINYLNKPEYYKNNQWNDNTAQNLIYIKRLAILPKSQRKGFGKICLNFIEKEYPEHWIRMDVITQNVAAQNLYEKVGYKRSGSTTTKNQSGDWNVICFEKLTSKL